MQSDGCCIARSYTLVRGRSLRLATRGGPAADHFAGANTWLGYGFVTGRWTTLKPKFSAWWHSLHAVVRSSNAVAKRAASFAATAASSPASGSVVFFGTMSLIGSGASSTVG